MSNIAFKLRFTYKNIDEEIPNLDYKVTFQSLVFPTTTRVLDSDQTTKEGKVTKTLYTHSEKGILRVFVKGGPTKYKTFTQIYQENIEKDYFLNGITLTLPLSLIKILLTTEVKGPSKTYESDYHQVKSGENLASIAKKYNKEISLLMRSNNISDANEIKIGQKIFIGSANTSNQMMLQVTAPKEGYFIEIDYIVNAGDTLLSIARKFNLNAERIKQDNKITDTYSLYAGQRLKLINHSAKFLGLSNQKLILKKLYTESLLPITKVSGDYTRQISVTIGAQLWEILGASLELGVAYDARGNWMLYYAVEDSISIDKSAINLHGGNVKKISDDIGFSLAGSNIKTNAKHVSELTGAGYSLTNSVNLGAYNVGLMNVKSKTKDYETGGDKDIDGIGGVGQINIGGKSINTPNINNQVGASIVIPLFIYNRKVKE
ncbi:MULTISPECIES: LysM peptidoglycan-binding domain-containing protein [Acinetobacter]|jgi:LysM repeat protein|uniref:LysM peptidoglycan-binding domain-containing protein n=1 Tax=Acinetobacter TaxID=469 RepID=UPI00241C34E0|nr:MULTISPECIES: LysM domain-containing protein [Acinetobacter]HJP48310.1 LysM domain-containing protein [Acinetobacter venetianus]